MPGLLTLHTLCQELFRELINAYGVYSVYNPAQIEGHDTPGKTILDCIMDIASYETRFNCEGFDHIIEALSLFLQRRGLNNITEV